MRFIASNSSLLSAFQFFKSFGKHTWLSIAVNEEDPCYIAANSDLHFAIKNIDVSELILTPGKVKFKLDSKTLTALINRCKKLSEDDSIEIEQKGVTLSFHFGNDPVKVEVFSPLFASREIDPDLIDFENVSSLSLLPYKELLSVASTFVTFEEDSFWFVPNPNTVGRIQTDLQLNEFTLKRESLLKIAGFGDVSLNASKDAISIQNLNDIWIFDILPKFAYCKSTLRYFSCPYRNEIILTSEILQHIEEDLIKYEQLIFDFNGEELTLMAEEDLTVRSIPFHSGVICRFKFSTEAFRILLKLTNMVKLSFNEITQPILLEGSNLPNFSFLLSHIIR